MAGSKIAVIAGDGIGPEVVAATQEVVAATGLELDYQDGGVSARRYLREGLLLTDDDLTLIRGRDAVLLGAFGDHRSPAESWSEKCCCGCDSSWISA